MSHKQLKRVAATSLLSVTLACGETAEDPTMDHLAAGADPRMTDGEREREEAPEGRVEHAPGSADGLEMDLKRPADYPRAGLGGAGHCGESEPFEVAGQETGEVWCAEGAYVHRPQARVVCPHVEGDVQYTYDRELDECGADSECGELEVCITGEGHRVCVARCESDDDCIEGSVCSCSGRQASWSDGTYGQCVVAGCEQDSDCGDGMHCVRTKSLEYYSIVSSLTVVWGPQMFHCQSALDECSASEGDCYWDGERRVLLKPSHPVTR